MSEILLFGQGWIGSRMAEFLKCDISSRRINTYEDAQEEIDKYNPKAIINCIGNIGKNMDDCEINKTKTLSSHVFVPLLLVEAALRNKIKLVHVSSGCLFRFDHTKDSPISESAMPDWNGHYYTRTKEYAEAALCALGDSVNVLIVRPRLILDYIPHPKNLLDKLISFKSVVDLPSSVSYMPDFLEAVRHLLKIDATGIYHTVNYGGLKFPELLEKYREYYPNHQYAITSQAELKTIRTHPILSTDRLEESGFDVRDIHDVLHECVEKWVNIRKNNAGQNKQAQVKESGVISNYPTKIQQPGIS